MRLQSIVNRHYCPPAVFDVLLAHEFLPLRVQLHAEADEVRGVLSLGPRRHIAESDYY